MADNHNTEAAIQAFRTMERAGLNLELAEYKLQKTLLRDDVDMDEYMRRTEEIRADFERQREALTRTHKLPERSPIPSGRKTRATSTKRTTRKPR